MKCFLSNKFTTGPSVSRNLLRIAPVLTHNVALNRNYSDSPPSSTPMFQGLYTSLSESAPVLKSQEFLELIHDQTHLPWWATIIASTVTLRLLITFPLSAYQVLHCHSIGCPCIIIFIRFFKIFELALHLWESRELETRNGSANERVETGDSDSNQEISVDWKTNKNSIQPVGEFDFFLNLTWMYYSIDAILFFFLLFSF